MKVILNNDVPNLGELGDVKEVALGYARNFLLPRGLALPYNQKVVALFEKRKSEIEALKAKKRLESSDLKTRLEAEEISLVLPAGANGKLYGAVTNATVADELLKKGFSVDRKRIEIPGRVIKSVGNYKVAIRLYEKDEATIKLVIRGQSDKEARAEAAAAATTAPKVERFKSAHVDEDEEIDERLPEDRD